MFKLDNDFLQSLGLGGLPVDEKNRLLQMIYERLEMNVGMRLAEKMTDQQLDEFEGFIDRNDEAGALKWLETNFPNYKDVVAEELEKLRGEVTIAAPQILAAQGGAGQQMPPIGQSPMMPGVPQYPPTQMQPQQMQQPAFTAPQPQFAPQPFQQPASNPALAVPQQPAPQFQPEPQPPMQQPAPQFAPVPQQPVYQPPAQQPPEQPMPHYAPQPPQPQPQQFTPPPPGFTPGQ